MAELPPKATIDYRVTVTTSRPGPISLQAEATSRRQTQPAAGEKTVEVLPEGMILMNLASQDFDEFGIVECGLMW